MATYSDADLQAIIQQAIASATGQPQPAGVNLNPGSNGLPSSLTDAAGNPVFIDPAAGSRNTLQTYYGGNGTTDPGVQAVIQQVTQQALQSVRGRQDQAQHAGDVGYQAIGATGQAQAAAQQQAMSALLADAQANGGGAGASLQGAAQGGQAHIQGLTQALQQYSNKLTGIDQAAYSDQLGRMQQLGQGYGDQASRQYAQVLASLDAATAAAHSEWQQNLAQIAANASAAAGGGGRRRSGGRRRGGGSGGSSGGGGDNGLQPSDLYEPYAKDVNNPNAGNGGPDDPLAIAQTIYRLTTGGESQGLKTPTGATKAMR